MYKILLVDDFRFLPDCDIARSGEDALRVINTEKYDVIIMDHDLGEGMTGYEMVNKALEEGILPPRVQFITNNPVGRENMIRAIENAGYICRGGMWSRP